MTPPEIDDLKDEVSRAWLGTSGVVAVGVRNPGDGGPVVVVSLEGHDQQIVDRLRTAYAGRPVVVETDIGPISLRAT